MDKECERNMPGNFAFGGLQEKYAGQIALSGADFTAALAIAHYVEI